MRVLAGSLKGRPLGRPKSLSVRPMGDKVRAALFDVVGSVTGFRVLDAYAGSGAVGIEALSRGAEQAIGIEASPAVAQTIQKTVLALDLGFTYQLVNSSVESWLARPSDDRFDLIIADPPYERLDDELVSRLGQRLTPHGALVLSHSSRIASPALESLELVLQKVYGDSALSFYK